MDAVTSFFWYDWLLIDMMRCGGGGGLELGWGLMLMLMLHGKVLDNERTDDDDDDDADFDFTEQWEKGKKEVCWLHCDGTG